MFIGLYRDDGLPAIIKNKSARLADKTRKELQKGFEQFCLKITAESNLHVVNFLDVTFDLYTWKYKHKKAPGRSDQWRHQFDNGGGHNYIFVYCTLLISFKNVSISKEINCAEHEYIKLFFSGP